MENRWVYDGLCVFVIVAEDVLTLHECDCGYQCRVGVFWGVVGEVGKCLVN